MNKYAYLHVLQGHYGQGWEGALLDAYGVAPDAQRTGFYRLVWDVGDVS